MADVSQMSEQMKSMKMFEIRNMAKEAGIRGHTIVKKPKLISLNSCIIAKRVKNRQIIVPRRAIMKTTGWPVINVFTLVK